MRWISLGICLALAAGSATAAAEQAVNAELMRLHDDLRLSDSQGDAWRDYTRAINPSPDTLARHRATSELLPLVPTPRRIALIEATMAQDMADYERQAAAVKAFYGRLTPEQQRTFDRDTLPDEQEPRR
jgi:periplasmic protein CpxP/Spy